MKSLLLAGVLVAFAFVLPAVAFGQRTTVLPLVPENEIRYLYFVEGAAVEFEYKGQKYMGYPVIVAGRTLGNVIVYGIGGRVIYSITTPEGKRISFMPTGSQQTIWSNTQITTYKSDGGPRIGWSFAVPLFQNEIPAAPPEIQPQGTPPRIVPKEANGDDMNQVGIGTQAIMPEPPAARRALPRQLPRYISPIRRPLN